jgi:hypothetical protein
MFDTGTFSPVVFLAAAAGDCAFDDAFDSAFDVCSDTPPDGGRVALRPMRILRRPEDPDELLALI